MAALATIGTFVVECGDLSTPDSRRLRTAANAMATSMTATSCIHYPPSLLQSAAASKRTTRRMLLQGPPKSGRSSVAMDLAYAIAAATPCREHCKTSSSSCRCIAVTLFLAADNNAQDSFPLYCQELTKNQHAAQETALQSFQVQIQQLEQSKAATRHATWKMDILRRIQVRHVVSVREVWKYLMTVQGKPVGEQPWGGILIDSLDALTADRNRLNEEKVRR
jgi:hypothetical protein